MLQPNNPTIIEDVSRALFEDLSDEYYSSSTSLSSALDNDITANLISSTNIVSAQIICREAMIVCGRAWAEQTFQLVDPDITLDWHYEDAQRAEANSCIVDIRGQAKSILTAERTALNFLQFLSGTATITAKYVSLLSGTRTKLLDTRKTIPMFRQAQKYAVRCGGGQNHRIGLYDAFLIKENHIKACGGIQNAVLQARKMYVNKKVEVEVETIEELHQAINAKADIIMLDNFSLKQIQEAVSINNQQCKLEVSGNITEQRLTELAKTGVDFVSSGAITKHVKAIDLSLLIL